MTSDPVIRIENLSFRYPGADRDTLRNADLTIERGDFVAVVGGNGAAKTTLCKTLNGLIPHYWSGEFAGTVTVDGVDTFTSSVAALSDKVGYVYQDFQNQLVRPTVADEVAFGPINFGHHDHVERTIAAIEAVGLSGLESRFVWQLSGGQSHLTALAGVLALRPAVVVVDEPVAELDPAHAEEVYERLAEANREQGLTVIVIEHHAEFVARYAKSVVLMADGAPVWHLPVGEAMSRVDELEAHGIPAPQLVRAVRALGIAESPRTVTDAAALLRGRFEARAAHEGGTMTDAAPDAPSRDTPSLDAASLDTVRAAGAASVTDLTLPAMADTVVSASRVGHGYRSVGGGLTSVLRDLDLELRRGDRVALVGGNGAGKSTLLRLLAGIDVPREGIVTVDGIDSRSKSARRLAEHASYLHQRPQLMFLTGSVRDDIAMFPRSRRVADVDALVDRILDRMRLTEHADRDGRTLSGGQQRRATLGIGLAMRPALLLLDEPTSSLDTASREAVTALLADLADVIACTVVATHDMQLVAEWATRVIVLDGGAVAADVTPAELFADEALLTRTRLVPPEVTRLGAALGMHPLPLSVDEFVAGVAAPLLAGGVR